MEVLRDGKFTVTLSNKDLAKGLRKNDKLSRDRHGMIEMTGLVSQDDVITALDELSRIDTDVITDSFPYPQLFILSNYILICSSTKIYDYSSGSLELKITTTAGSTWKVIDFIEYLVLTNGIVNVIRTASSGVFSVTTDFPEANAICNYNGQVLIGGPK